MRASIDRTVAVMLTILVLGTYAFGGLLDGIKKGVSDISNTASKSLDDIAKPASGQTAVAPSESNQEKVPVADKSAPSKLVVKEEVPPANSKTPETAGPLLEASQVVLDEQESKYEWALSPTLRTAWEENFSFGSEGFVRAQSLNDEKIKQLKQLYHIRNGETFLMATKYELVINHNDFSFVPDYREKIAVTDKAVYFMLDNVKYSPAGILRFPHAAFLSISTDPQRANMRNGSGGYDVHVGPIKCDGKPVVIVKYTVIDEGPPFSYQTGQGMFNIMADICNHNAKFFKLALQEKKSASLPEITDLTGYKGVKAESPYTNAMALLSPQLSEDFFEYEFVQKFWSDESWSSARVDSFKGANWALKNSFAPELQFKQDPFDHLSFPFIWPVTGFAYGDKTGVNRTYFIDDKFYSFSSALNEEFAAKGQAIAQSMSKKYGQPLWEVANSSKQESRCVWENENGAIIATFEGGWSQPPWLFVGSALSYAATNGLSCDYTVLSYGLADGPVKKDTAVRFKALWFNKINDMDFAVPEIPANGRVLVIGFAMKIKEAAKAKKHGMEEEVETVASLIQRYNMFAQRDPDDPRLPGLKDRIEKAKVDAVKQQAEGEGKLRLEGNARDELFAKTVILDDKNKEHKMTGSFSCDYQKINYMAFCEVPADSKRFLLVTPDGKRVVIEPVQSSWHFLGPLDLTVLNENRFKLTKIDYFSKTMRQYVENKIEKLKNEGKKQAETLKKQEAGEVQGF